MNNNLIHSKYLIPKKMLELNNQQHFLKNLFPHNDYVPLNITSTFQVCLFVCFRSLNHTHMRSSRDYSTLVGVMVKYFTQFPQFYLIMASRIFFSFRALFPNILEPAGVSQISLEHFHPPPPAATSPRCLFKPTSLSFNKFITEQTPWCFFLLLFCIYSALGEVCLCFSCRETLWSCHSLW